MTKKSSDSQRLKKIYREYARIKFKKYKLQFPRLRESEIVSKILREWEAMNEEQKLDLEKEFLERGSGQFLAVSSSSSRKKKEQAAQGADKSSGVDKSKDDDKKKKKKEKKSSPKVRVFQSKDSSDKRESPSVLLSQLDKRKVGRDESSDFRKSEDNNPKGKSSTPDKDKKDSSSSLDYLAKTKMIQKKRKRALRRKKEISEYATFQKYYCDKLAAEHPRWSKTQTQTIVKLLWKKKVAGRKRERTQPRKGLTGRQLYRRQKQSQGMMKEQIKVMWKTLPHESKIYWNMKGGKNRIHKSERATGAHVRRILNSGAAKQEKSESGFNFGWMGNQIQ